MEFLLHISPLIKLAVVFVFILALMRFRLSLGTALMGGSVVLGLWFGLSPLKIGASMVRALSARQTLTLCLIVTLILVLSHAMEKTGHMKRLLESFKAVSQNVRLNLAIFPALIGLLPMPGGAIFSAPMVHEMSHEEALAAERKTMINYWFRHIWEFSWPLYPGVILASALSGIDLWTFVLVQFPLTLFSAAVGYVTLLRSIPFRKPPRRPGERGRCRRFVMELMPLLLVVGGALFLGGLIYLLGNAWPALRDVRKEIPLIAALVISVAWVWKWNHMVPADVRRVFLNKSLVSMIFMIAGIMAFQGVLKDSMAISEISKSLTSARVPVTLVIVVLPFLVGSITGITMAFVGTTFPIVFSLLADAGMAQNMAGLHAVATASGENHILAYTVLAFVSGYLGVLLSPLHVCLVLSCEYFKTTLLTTYRHLWLPCGALALAGLVSFWANLVF